ncbi:MAG: acyl-CoA dehydrogenase [Candidatus Binatia bacterium]|nr:MAG: acyl-CoA dehydrogenase [Candidatus Binatia bacterium]
MNLFHNGHEEFRTRVRRFVEERLAPHADEWERRKVLPRSVFTELGQQGFLGLTRPREYGGLGLDFGYNVVLAEELPRARMPGLTLSVLAQVNFVPPLLVRYGTEEQKREFLVPALRGEKIGALASTEPTGGSDIVNATRCRAVDDGDFWVIEGEKKFITNGPIADFVVCLVRTRPEPTPNSFSLVIVPTDTPGFRVKATLEKLGLHTSPTGWLEFDGCRVPKSYTIGRPNVGFFYHVQNLLEERLIGGVSAVALASLVLEDTMSYLRGRVAYGKPLSRLHPVRQTLAELASYLEMARRFVYSVCESFRDGRVEAKEICMIKFAVVEVVQRLVERCLQLHGGYGFLEENWLTRVYRDVRVLSLGGGTSEVMKDLVAGYLRL